MPHDIAFKVGDQIRCTTGRTGNGIIVMRRTEHPSMRITYTVFTDFGNTIRLNELELLNDYVPIELDPTLEELYGDNVDKVLRWLNDRALLVVEQMNEYDAILKQFPPES